LQILVLLKRANYFTSTFLKKDDVTNSGIFKSFLLGRMAWSRLNGLLVISGALDYLKNSN
jgi:hypothetical protein